MTVFSFDYFIHSFSKLMPYLPVTLIILLISLVFSISFGMFFAWCKLRKNKVVKGVVMFFTEVIRGTPFIVLLFVIYFGLPKLLLNIAGVDVNGWNKSIYIIITLAIFGSARMSEAMRSAYLAVNKNQMEAAISCGLSEWQGFIFIIFPQALLIALPNMGNLILSNLLETAVGFSIGIVDFVGNARLINTREYGVHTLEIYVALALVYWIMSILLAKLFDFLEEFLKSRQGLSEKKNRKKEKKREVSLND